MAQKYYRWAKWLLIASLVIMVGTIALFGGFYKFYYHDLVQEMDIENYHYQPAQRSLIYSEDEVLLAEVYQENRIHVDLPQVASTMQAAIIAIEDHRFYDHHGVDVVGTFRSLLKNMRSGEVMQGGSTITQQLARNLFLSNEVTYTRKLKEMALAIALERRYSKEEILGMYLNQIYFGSGYHGVEVAAQKYFGKPAAELELAESALLAAVPNRPNDYELHDHLAAALPRQQLILDRMLSLGKIGQQTYQEAVQQPIEVLPFNHQQGANYKYPYFVMAAMEELNGIVDKEELYSNGLVVHTTLDTKVQQVAEDTITEHINKFAARRIAASNIALASVVPQTGAVAALVGGQDFQTDQNNLALTPRQPGSTIKPFVYAAALNSGKIRSDTLLNASPRKFNGYMIKNGGSWNGNVALQDAIKHSLNVPVAEALEKQGIGATADYLKRFGVSTVSDQDYNYAALALGGMYHGIKPLELAAAFGVFANGGEYQKPHLITKITDHQGQVIYQHQSQSRAVLKKNIADTMHYFLKGVVNGGTGSRASIPWESAGKTGTTDDGRCLWYVGYTSNLSTAIWVGNNDNTPVSSSATGGTVAAPVWRQYMTSIIKQKYINRPASSGFRPKLGATALTPDEDEEEELESPEEIENQTPSDPEDEGPTTWLPTPPPTPPSTPDPEPEPGEQQD